MDQSIKEIGLSGHLKKVKLPRFFFRWHYMKRIRVRQYACASLVLNPFKGIAEFCFQTANAFKVHGYCFYSMTFIVPF